MKLKKLLIPLSLLLSVLLLLSSCGGREPAFFLKEKADPILKEGAHLSDLDGYDIDAPATGKLWHLKKEQATPTLYSHAILNEETGTVVRSVSEAAGESYTYSFYTECFIERKFVDASLTSLTVYDAVGNAIKQFAAPEALSVSMDEYEAGGLIKLNDAYYRKNQDGSFSLAFESAFKDIRSIGIVSSMTESYRLMEDGDRLLVYDKDYNLLSIAEIPDYAVLNAAYLFENGNLFFQYAFVADQLSDEYDYLDSGIKYCVKTKLMKADGGKISDVRRFSYVLDGTPFTPIDEETLVDYSIDDGYEGYLYGNIYKIENRLLTGVEGKLFGMKDGGQMEEISSPIKNIDLTEAPIKVGDKYLIKTLDGNFHCYDPKTDKMIPVKFDSYNSHYFVYDEKVYSYDGIALSAAKDYTVEAVYSGAILLKKYDGLANADVYSFLKADGTIVALGQDVSIGTALLLVKNDTVNSYTAYDANGKEICTVSAASAYLLCEDPLSGRTIVAFRTDGVTKYYSFS